MTLPICSIWTAKLLKRAETAKIIPRCIGISTSDLVYPHCKMTGNILLYLYFAYRLTDSQKKKSHLNWLDSNPHQKKKKAHMTHMFSRNNMGSNLKNWPLPLISINNSKKNNWHTATWAPNKTKFAHHQEILFPKSPEKKKTVCFFKVWTHPSPWHCAQCPTFEGRPLHPSPRYWGRGPLLMLHKEGNGTSCGHLFGQAQMVVCSQMFMTVCSNNYCNLAILGISLFSA